VVLDGLASFTGQAQNKIAVHHQAKFVTILGELACAFDRSALLNIFQDLRVAGLVGPRSAAGIQLLSLP